MSSSTTPAHRATQHQLDLAYTRALAAELRLRWMLARAAGKAAA